MIAQSSGYILLDCMETFRRSFAIAELKTELNLLDCFGLAVFTFAINSSLNMYFLKAPITVNFF